MYSFGMQFQFGGHPTTEFVGVVSKKEVSYLENGDLDVKFTVSTQVSEYDSEAKKTVTRTSFYNFHETGKDSFDQNQERLTPLGMIAKYVEDNEMVKIVMQIDTLEGEPRTWLDKDSFAHGSWNGKVLLVQTLMPKWMKDMTRDHAAEYRDAARGNSGRRQQAVGTRAPAPTGGAPAPRQQPATPAPESEGQEWS